MKRIFEFALVLAMAVSLFSITASASGVPEGYTTDEYGLMAYKYDDYYDSFDIMGVFDGDWKQVTYRKRGFSTSLKIGETTENIDAISTEAGGYTVDGLNIAIDLSIENEGQTVAIAYTVENITENQITYHLASGADVQIGSDDSAEITSFSGNLKGFKMVSDYTSDYNEETGEYAQFNAFLGGAQGITEVSGYWFGSYSDRKNNLFTTEPGIDSYSRDSGATWHWADQTIGAGETKVHTIKMGIGGADSEDVLDINEYNVTGRVVDQQGNALENIVVKLAEEKTDTTDENGVYTIDAVKKGVYGASMTSGSNVQTTTVVVTATSNEETLDLGNMIFVVDGNKNTSVEAGAGLPDFSAGNLADMFTEEDDNGSKVDITLKVDELESGSEDKASVDELALGQNDVGMYFDITLEKTVTPNSGEAETSLIQPSDDKAVKITLSIPEAHQNKAPYQIIHVHDGVAEILNSDYDDELQTLTFDGKQFSTYAYTFKNTEITVYDLDFMDVGTDGSDDNKYKESDAVLIDAGSRSGYYFTGWVTEDGGSFDSQTSAATTYTMPANTVTLTATWAENDNSSTPASYTSSVADTDNGTVALSSSKNKLNSTVTITATPDEGYEVQSVTVTYGNGREVSVTDNGDGTYSYKQPGASAIVSVVFVETEIETDTEEASTLWYTDALNWAEERGIIDNQSGALEGCTRADAVYYIWLATGGEDCTVENPFVDIWTDDAYYSAVLWAVEQGIAEGISDTEFDPYSTCTRGQIMTFLWRAADQPEVEIASDFIDVDDDFYYASAVAWAVEQGITTGISDTTFEPDADCSREQIITFLYRSLAQ